MSPNGRPKGSGLTPGSGCIEKSKKTGDGKNLIFFCGLCGLAAHVGQEPSDVCMTAVTFAPFLSVPGLDSARGLESSRLAPFAPRPATPTTRGKSTADLPTHRAGG